jgi:carboxyl-terminal processing protease
MTRVRIAWLALACALIGLVIGLWAGGHPADLPGFLRGAFVSDDRATRAELIDSIEDNFYRPVSRSALEDASLKGIVGALHDPFSHYLTPQEAKSFQESVEGQFEGVGMSVAEDRRGLRVVNVFAGSPAIRAGIRRGDLITAVNGRSIAGESSEVATAKIKGRPGTHVRLGVLSPASGRKREISLVRARIEVPVARGRVVSRGGHKLAVIQLLSFSSGAHGFVDRALRSALARGAQGVVLDLRGNGGGLLREAVLVSSAFIERGKIVSVRGRRRPERTEDATGGAIAPHIPLVVLVDRGSASASEIVTGALRDHRRATVVGTRTFGKGLVEEVQPLSNGGLLDLTVARYYLPDGEGIGRRGITPQVPARDNARTGRDEAVPTALDVLLKQLR